MKNKVAISFVLMLVQFNLLSQANLPTDSIYKVFSRVKQICNRDNGKLWGKKIYSSILLIDRSSRKIVANEPDKEGLLTPKDEVFTGQFPETSIIANSTTQFGGKFWTMVAYPLPANDYETNKLFVHELFHQLQNKIGLNGNGYDNSHMDNFEARIYLKMEWLALLSALNSKGKNAKAISDALLFRTYRRSLFPGADSMENKFEIGEGLAEYTGYKLCTDSKKVVSELNKKRESYWSVKVRAFGYYSGTLYGFLLDKYAPEWKKNLKYNDDLGLRLKNALHIKFPGNIEDLVNKSRVNYGFDTIYTSELDLKKKKEEIIFSYKKAFTSGSVVKFDLISPHFGFNPNSLQPLDTLGTVFPTIEMVDNWGILKVTEGGCLVSKDWKLATIPAIDIKISENSVTGNGWTLKINDGWEIIKEQENYTVKKK